MNPIFEKRGDTYYNLRNIVKINPKRDYDSPDNRIDRNKCTAYFAPTDPQCDLEGNSLDFDMPAKELAKKVGKIINLEA